MPALLNTQLGNAVGSIQIFPWNRCSCDVTCAALVAMCDTTVYLNLANVTEELKFLFYFESLKFKFK